MDEREQILRLRAAEKARHQRLLAESRALVARVAQQVEHLHWLVSSIKREREPDFYKGLQDAIRRVHGCESRHVTGFAVRQVSGPQILWEGMVEEFDLIGHRTAQRCYAWRYSERGREQSISILKMPLVDTPQKAIQFHFMARGANFLHEDRL